MQLCFNEMSSFRTAGFRFAKTMWFGIVVSSALALSGCTSDRVEHSKPEDAKVLLNQVLTLWQQGRVVDELRSEKPPIFVQDERWRKGRKLFGFVIDADTQSSGPSAVIFVDLDFGPERKARRVSYLVSTTPVLSVTLNEE